MQLFTWAIVLLFFTAAGRFAAHAQQSAEANGRPAAAAAEFDEFALVLQRNIFDPERRKPRPVAEGGREERTAEPAEQPRRIIVLGTFIQGGQAHAVLEGEGLDAPGDAAPGDAVGELTIAEISAGSVVFKQHGQELRAPVGGELISRGGAAWQVGAESRRDPGASGSNRESFRGSFFGNRGQSRSRESGRREDSRGADAAPGASGAEGSSGGESGGGMSEVLKRMMERRAKELGQ